MKIRPLGAETDRQTKTTKLIIPFRNLSNALRSRDTKVISVIFDYCWLFYICIHRKHYYYTS